MMVLGFGVLLLGVSGCSKQAKLQKHLQRAEVFYRSNDYDKAKIEYLNALRFDQTNALAILRLGEILFDQGASEQAMPFLSQSLDRDPRNASTRLKVGQILLARNEYPKAREQALQVLTQSPTNEEAILLLTYASVSDAAVADAQQKLAKIRQQSGETAALHLASANFAFRKRNIQEATTEIQRALIVNNRSHVAHLALGNLYYAQTNFPAADQAFRTAAELAPPRSGAGVRYAEFKLQSGAGEAEARKIVDAVLAKAPDYLPAKQLLTHIALGGKRSTEALKLAEELLRQDPFNYENQLLLAHAYMEQGELKKAIGTFEKIDKSFVPSPDLKFELAKAYLLDKQIGKVVPLLDQAVALAPEFSDAIKLRCQIELRTGDAARAASGVQRLASRHPTDIPLQFLLAEAYSAMGRPEDAIATYTKLTRLFPSEPGIWYAVGMALRQNNRNAEARSAFERVRTLAPEEMSALYQLVELDLAEKQYGRALELLGKQAEPARSSATSRLIEGRIYAAQSDWPRAEASLRKAIELDSNLTGAYYLLISVFTQSKQRDKAAQELETMLAKNPKEERALLLLGMLQSDRKNYAESRKLYEQLLALRPNFIPALNNLAVVLAEHLNDPTKAYELAQKAHELAPEDASLSDTLGWVLFRQKKFSEALPLLRESAGRLRFNPEVQFHLGMVYYMLVQEGPARTSLAEALKSPNDFEGRTEAQQHLQLLTKLSNVKSAAEWATLIRDHPEDPFVKLRWAETLERDGTYDQAAQMYQQVLDISPKAVSALSAMARLNSGPLQNKARAAEFARRARDLAPSDPQVAAVAGRIAYDSRDFVASYNLLRESAQTLTNRADVSYDFGLAAYSVGQEGEAQLAMERALKLQPGSAIERVAKWFLAMTAVSRSPKETPDIQRQIQEVLKSDPNHVPALMAQAGLLSARGDGKAAAETYEKVLGIYPAFQSARRQLAVLYADDPTRDARTLELASKVKEAIPADVEMSRVLGKVYYRQKNYTAASLYLQESLNASPKDPQLNFLLGMSQYQSRDTARAKQFLERSVALGISEPALQEAKRVLASMTSGPGAGAAVVPR